MVMATRHQYVNTDDWQRSRGYRPACESFTFPDGTTEYKRKYVPDNILSCRDALGSRRSACAADQENPLQRGARRHAAWNFIYLVATPAYRQGEQRRTKRGARGGGRLSLSRTGDKEGVTDCRLSEGEISCVRTLSPLSALRMRSFAKKSAKSFGSA